MSASLLQKQYLSTAVAVCPNTAKVVALPAMNLADRLKLAREDAGLTQTELAVRMKPKMAQQTIQHLESGRNKGSKRLPDIADALGVRYPWLAKGDGPMRETAPSEALGPPAATPLDLSTLIAAVRDAEEVFVRVRKHPSPEGTAQVVAWFYRHYADGRHEKPPERDVRSLLRLVSSR